jgi:hypothetical protein
MSIIDKMKGALHSVTGGAAEVALVYEGRFEPGATLKVKITATSTAGALRAQGVFVDMRGKKTSAIGQVTGNVIADRDHSVQIFDHFELAAKESRAFEGEVEVPADIDASLDWEIRGRIEAFGNDPDSGFRDVVR